MGSPRSPGGREKGDRHAAALNFAQGLQSCLRACPLFSNLKDKFCLDIAGMVAAMTDVQSGC